MTKDEAKQLKYVETQRDGAKRELAEVRVQLRDATEKVKVLSEELEASLKGESATLDALKAKTTALETAQGDLRAEVEDLRVFQVKLQAVANTEHSEARRLQNENTRLANEVDTLKADTEGKEKLKMRLAAKAEELRLCRNELGGAKAAVAAPLEAKLRKAENELKSLREALVAPKTIENAILSVVKHSSAQAVVDVMLRHGLLKRETPPAKPAEAVAPGEAT
jgi:DNA repair exonuclease SbcCD ATPase subunit